MLSFSRFQVSGFKLTEVRMKMIPAKSYRDLTAWPNSMDLVLRCYQLTSQIPKTQI